MAQHAGTALVTGASAGIGAVYAERLAARGHDLILVARNAARLTALAEAIAGRHGVKLRVHVADLAKAADLRGVEALLASDPSITLLVNNAGLGAAGPLAQSSADAMEEMVAVNITAVMRLAHAAVLAFTARGRGTIVNIASVVAVAPEALNGVYGGSKAFVLALSRSLKKELAGSGVSVQVVLPGATATGIWDGMGEARPPASRMMPVETLVDAALADLEAGRFVSIPSLHDLGLWQAWETAREAMMPNLSSASAAPRYAGTVPA